MKRELTPFIIFVTVVAVVTATIAWAVPAPAVGDSTIIVGDNTTIIADNGITLDNLVVNENLTVGGVLDPFVEKAGDTMSGPLNLGGNPLENTKIVERHIIIPSCNFGKPVTDPPAVDDYGICQVLEFTVGTDKAYYKFHVPDDWVPGTDILVHAHWTRSSTGAVDSTKTVKWQMKYLAVDGVSQNVNSGESTLSVQDTYDSASMTDQIVYATDDVTVPESDLSSGDCVVVELMAITPTGTALSDPACAALGVTYMVYQVSPA